jgi:hypothetical protein
MEADIQGVSRVEIPKNSGFAVVTPTTEKPGVIAIAGTGRSGSTCVAKLLRETGVHVTATFGHKFGEYFAENVALNNALASKDLETLLMIANKISHEQWCFKRPGEFMHVKFGLNVLRRLKPCVIVVSRDTVASALCEINFQTKKQGNVDPEYWVGEYSLRNQRLLREAMVESEHTPTAFVSYEKLLSHPELITRKLCNFVDCEFKNQALSVVGNRQSYYRALA